LFTLSGCPTLQEPTHQHLISRLIAHKTNFVRACFLSSLAPPPPLPSHAPFIERKLLFSSAMHSIETHIPPSLPPRRGVKEIELDLTK
jgi:hypothetical protein